jgi:hypothetical protein
VDGEASGSTLGQMLGLGAADPVAVAVGACVGRLRNSAAVPPTSSKTGIAITATRTGRGKALTRLHIRIPA